MLKRVPMTHSILAHQVPLHDPGVHRLLVPPPAGVHPYQMPPSEPGVHLPGPPTTMPVYLIKIDISDQNKVQLSEYPGSSCRPSTEYARRKSAPKGTPLENSQNFEIRNFEDKILQVEDNLPQPATAALKHQHPYPRNRLDVQVEKAARAFQQAATFRDFIRQARGCGDLHPNIGQIPHPAAHLLAQYQQSGTPGVMQTENWAEGRTRAALKQGSHSSSKNNIDFLRKEYANMIDKQQWTVLPAHLVLNIDKLRLSPLGLVPQRGRCNCMISDYSYVGVNSDTLRLAPAKAIQFDKALTRLLTKIHHSNKRFKPVY